MRIPAFVQTLLTNYFRWIAVGAAVGVLALGYFLVLDSKISALRTSGVLERAQVESALAGKREYLTQLRASLEKFKTSLSPSDLAGIDGFIPTGPDFPGLLLALEAIAASANLQLDSMNVNEIGQVVAASGSADQVGSGEAAAQAATPSGVNLQTQDVNVTVSGGSSYEAFKRFITQVESSRRLLDVVSVSFSHSIEAGAAGTTPYTVVIRTYYLPANRS
jgi:Tfp pilus assembly protein PilO